MVCGCVFFVFQAEDGIRDVAVTGVQTCALPIFIKYPGEVGVGLQHLAMLVGRQSFARVWPEIIDRKSTRLNSSHGYISYAVFCLKKKNEKEKKHLLPLKPSLFPVL